MVEPAIASAEIGFETAPKRPVLEVYEGGGETTPPTGQLETVEDLSGETVAYPGVIRVSEIPGDEELTREAQRNIRTRLVGGLALGETLPDPASRGLIGYLRDLGGDRRGFPLKRGRTKHHGVPSRSRSP